MANIQSGATSDLLTVDPTSKAARVSMYDASGNNLLVKSGVALPIGGLAGLPMAGVNDGASRLARFDRYGNIRIGAEQMLFKDSAETIAVSGVPISPNLNQWSTSVSGFAVGAPVANGNQLTAASVTTLGAYSIATTLRLFSKAQKVPLFYRRRGRNSQVAGTVSEFGFGAPTGATANISNSAHWRFNASGLVQPVVTFNGTEIVGTDISTLLTSSNYYTWEIIVDDDNALFVVQDVSTGKSISEQTIQIALTSSRIWSVARLPVFERVYNNTAPASAPLVYFSDVYVCSFDAVANKSFQTQIVSSTQGGSEVYPGAFVAANAQNANYPNSAAAASGALSNTVPSYTTLGGMFQFASVAGSETDYALFAFTVPAGFTFHATGIRIGAFNSGAPGSATSATLLMWSVATNSSSVSLATIGLTRLTIGNQTIPASSPVGTAVQDIDMPFDTPLITHGGRLFHVILRMPVGAVTPLQIIRGSVAIRGFFE